MHRLATVALIAALAACGQGSVPVDVSRAVPASPPAPSTSVASTSTQPSRPLPSVTPGLVVTTRAEDVCTTGWASAHRQSLTAAQKRAVLAAYRLPASTKVAEWDHRVPLELGGGNGTANIWPDTSQTDRARKDRLENRLHREVCGGRLSLITAQSRIIAYWRYW